MGIRKDEHMEPVKNNSELELTEKRSNSSASKIDRVVLDPATMEAVKKLSDQVKNALGDLIEVTQKEVINFLLQERSQPFTELEIAKIKERNFDIVRALQHATEEARKAKNEGKDLSVNEILKYFQTPIVIEKSPSVNRRGRKKKINTPTESNEPSIVDSGAKLTTERANKGSSIFQNQDSRIEINSSHLGR